MPIFSTPPTAPTRSDPANFAAQADAWVAWLATFREELEAWAWGSIDDAITPAAGHVLAHDGTEWAPRTMMTVARGPWVASDVTGAGGAVTMGFGFFATATSVSSSTRYLKMPSAGRVVGATLVSNAARTNGNATLKVLINGARTIFDADSVSLDATYTDNKSSRVAYAAGLAFAAGDTLGVEVVPTAGWAPSADMMAWLDIAYAPF